MSWFQRKRATSADEASGDEATPDADTPDLGTADADTSDGEAGDRTTAQDDDAARAEELRRSHGPFDLSEMTGERTRIDLGALRLPAMEGMELRLEVEEKTQRVIAATVSLAGSSVQLQAFAAPAPRASGRTSAPTSPPR